VKNFRLRVRTEHKVGSGFRSEESWGDPIRNIKIHYLKTYLDAGVVKAGVEHDNGEGEDVAGVRIGEYIRIQLAVPEENILQLTNAQGEQELAGR
jgi:hypothetical protein